MIFFRNLDPHNNKKVVGCWFNGKRVVISGKNVEMLKSYFREKCWFEAAVCLMWKLSEYANDHSPDACIIPTL